MQSIKAKKQSMVFMYPDVAAQTVAQIESGSVPKERLTGFYQLKERGWSVRISDSRWLGPVAGIRRKLLRFVELPSLSMLRDWLGADVIVVKDNFSLILTLIAKVLRKKIVYLDSMFRLPKDRVRRFLIKRSLELADAVICFSSTQADLWAKTFEVEKDLFTVVPYAMDCDFYPLQELRSSETPSVISVGRDVGRDFGTLLKSIENKEAHLKLVTLPYLLPDSVKKFPNVEVKERLSYEELFSLYGGASLAVVPLESGLTYPSGIRAVMEAMLVGTPVIATYTPVLAEYFNHEEDLLFVDPESEQSLSEAIDLLLANHELRDRLRSNARKKMEQSYALSVYVNALEETLVALDDPQVVGVPG
jgi:glycosyltransferase involved in cell wall biosynthesis